MWFCCFVALFACFLVWLMVAWLIGWLFIDY